MGEREPGFYWVRIETTWLVARWAEEHGGRWRFTDGGFARGDSTLIDESGPRITPPDAAPQGQDGRTVRVRIAVAADEHGHWSAAGGSRFRDDDARRMAEHDTQTPRILSFVEANVPAPELPPLPATIEGEVRG